MSDGRFDYQEHDLNVVLRHFADGFKAPKGRRIAGVESFVDIGKGVVVFKVFTLPSAEGEKE